MDRQNHPTHADASRVSMTRWSTASSSTQLNAMTFDIEDWFHLLDRSKFNDAAEWDGLPTIVERYTDLILDTLAESGVTATFFIVGWVARQHPLMVRRIADAGHEVACHSYWHRRIDRMDRATFRHDLRMAIDILADQLGEPVRGFRAPGFSVSHAVPWFFAELLDAGIEYDASVLPASRNMGTSGEPTLREPHERYVAEAGRSIRLLPMSVVRLGPWQVRYSGAGYLRLLPTPVLMQLMRHENAAGRPNVVYLHPRDFAVDCPRAKLSAWKAFRTYHGLHTTTPKLRALLEAFRFGTAAEVVGLHCEAGTMHAAAQASDGVTANAVAV